MMEEPQETDIKISDLFKEYKKFVAGDMEVEGREIVIDDYHARKNREKLRIVR